MERAGEGLAARDRRPQPRRARRRRLRQGQQRRRRARGRAAAARRGPRRRACSPCGRPTSCGATRRPSSSGCRARRRSRSTPRRLDGRRRARRRPARHRLQRRAARRRADAVIAALDAADAPVVAADVPSGVNASTGEVEGAAVRAVATATFHLAKPGLWIAPGKAHAGRVEVIPHRHPARARRAARRPGCSAPRVLDVLPAPRRGVDEVQLGQRRGRRRLAGLTGAPTMAALGRRARRARAT